MKYFFMLVVLVGCGSPEYEMVETRDFGSVDVVEGDAVATVDAPFLHCYGSNGNYEIVDGLPGDGERAFSIFGMIVPANVDSNSGGSLFEQSIGWSLAIENRNRILSCELYTSMGLFRVSSDILVHYYEPVHFFCEASDFNLRIAVNGIEQARVPFTGEVESRLGSAFGSVTSSLGNWSWPNEICTANFALNNQDLTRDISVRQNRFDSMDSSCKASSCWCDIDQACVEDCAVEEPVLDDCEPHCSVECFGCADNSSVAACDIGCANQ